MSPWKQWKRAFDQWEGTTAHFIEQWMKSPLLLEPAGAWLSAAMRVHSFPTRRSFDHRKSVV